MSLAERRFFDSVAQVKNLHGVPLLIRTLIKQESTITASETFFFHDPTHKELGSMLLLNDLILLQLFSVEHYFLSILQKT